MRKYLYCIVRKYTEFSNRKVDIFGSLVRMKYHDTFYNSDEKEIVSYFFDKMLIEDYAFNSMLLTIWKTDRDIPVLRTNVSPLELVDNPVDILFEVTMLKELAEAEIFQPQLQNPTSRIKFYIFEASDDASAQLLYDNYKEEGVF